jgi:phosphatidylinositol glycan class B
MGAVIELLPPTPGLRRGFWSIIALGALLRAIGCFIDGPVHPDEYFQYLEPAWWRLTGVGIETWEWFDGLRSWVLPSYHGAWFAGLRALGFPKGAPLAWFIKLHWALINTALVWVAYRGAACVTRACLRSGLSVSSLPASAPGALRGAEGGLLGALLVAVFPTLVLFSSHTLSELPSLLCLCAGLVLCAELLQDELAHGARGALTKAAWSGALLSLGACLRIVNGPLALVPALWLLLRGRFRLLLALVAGALVPALAFALVDLLTWGKLAGSYVAYVKFNFIEGKAATFGTEPPTYYLDLLRKRLPWTLGPLLLSALWGLRATWPFLGSAGLALGYLSTQAHKEERFIILVWPLVLIACAGVVGAWLARLRSAGPRLSLRRLQLARVVPWVVLGSLGVLFLADAALHTDGRGWHLPAVCQNQAWIGRQPGVTGVLVEGGIDAGGSFWFGNTAPQIEFAGELLTNPLISHVLVRVGGYAELMARHSGYTEVHRIYDFVVLARTP